MDALWVTIAAATAVARRSTTLAFRAGFGSQAGRAAQWRWVPRLGRADSTGAGAPSALAGSDDSDRQMVAILSAADGLPAVEAVCAFTMTEGVHSSDVPGIATQDRPLI
jgi:hypothetical protein